MDYLFWNEIPTVVGNLVGGLAFTGLTLYATHIKTAPKRAAPPRLRSQALDLASGWAHPRLGSEPSVVKAEMSRELKISVGQHSDNGRKETNQDFHGVLIPDEPLLGLKGIAVVLANGIPPARSAGSRGWRSRGS